MDCDEAASLEEQNKKHLARVEELEKQTKSLVSENKNVIYNNIFYFIHFYINK